MHRSDQPCPPRDNATTPYELPQWPERGADLRCEELRLLPGGEVTALVDLVPVDEVAEGPLSPAPRRAVDLGREHRDRHREGRDVERVERAAPGLRAFPVRPRRRCPPLSWSFRSSSRVSSKTAEALLKSPSSMA